MKTTAQVIAADIRESLNAGGRCYVSGNGKPNPRRIFDVRVIGQKLKLRLAGPNEMEWYLVAVRDTITVNKLTPRESSTVVGAL